MRRALLGRASHVGGFPAWAVLHAQPVAVETLILAPTQSALKPPASCGVLCAVRFKFVASIKEA
jgi:hypothetical protein